MRPEPAENAVAEVDFEPEVCQRRLGRRGLVVFLGLTSAFVPLSTDLYLPALPVMTRYFQVAEYQTNLTLILFFVFYALATLIWGPLSDKYGRRPILIAGMTCYAIAGVMCALAPSIDMLIGFRALQAVGAGAASAVSTAIVKDTYRGKKRESILALVQSMVLISPAVAPVVGALLLRLTSWRGAFVAQAILGLAVVAGSLLFDETARRRNAAGVLRTIGRLGHVLGNRVFASLLLIFSMVSITSMAFISSSSYIYQETFGTSSQIYSYYFALNAVGLLLGPLIYVKLAARFSRQSIVSACFAVMILSGILVLAVGRHSAWLFALAILPASTVASCVRPPGTYLMLEQHRTDAGSASALMSSWQTIMGSLGMVIISFNLGDRVGVVGLLNVIFGLLCGVLWLILTRTSVLEPAEEA